MKKLFAILLALAMIFAMSATVFAADEDDTTAPKLTINNAAGHTYEIYQLFTGDVHENTLSNVVYGTNYYPNSEEDIGKPADSEILNGLVTVEDVLALGLKGDAQQTVSDDNGDGIIVVEGLTPGYYLVKDITANTDMPDDQTKSAVILQILGDATITSKHASLVPSKKVKDNDAGSDWQDSADYAYDQSVPFQLSVSLPTTLNNYATYALTFHDKAAAGFGEPAIGNVYIQHGDEQIAITNTDTTTNYVVDADGCGDENCGCAFTVTINNVKAIYEAAGETFSTNDKVVVEYTSVLEDGATVGAAGNINSMYVVHPDGKSVEDSVTVYTYKLVINKVDDNNQPLEGAGFKLYKKNADGEYEIIGAEKKGTNMTTFEWVGLDDGEYKLEESTVPAGYNKIDDIEFVITATHNPELTALSGGTLATGVVNTGVIAANVQNNAGSVLPETGAQGTFMLIGGGTLLVILAAVFMITRKKMSIFED